MANVIATVISVEHSHVIVQINRAKYRAHMNGYKRHIFRPKMNVEVTEPSALHEMKVIKPIIVEQKYDVVLETLIPATIHYQVTAKSPEEAIQKINNMKPVNVQHHTAHKRNIKVKVCDIGSAIVRLLKSW
jgi:cephalosporin hydroxylase